MWPRWQALDADIRDAAGKRWIAARAVTIAAGEAVSNTPFSRWDGEAMHQFRPIECKQFEVELLAAETEQNTRFEDLLA
jgi:hypothetical protein